MSSGCARTTIGAASYLRSPVKHDRPDILRLLLDGGLDPNERHRLEGIERRSSRPGSRYGAAPDEGKLEMAKLLLERGLTRTSTSTRAVPDAQGVRTQGCGGCSSCWRGTAAWCRR